MKKILFPYRFKNLNDIFENPEKNPKEFMYGMYELRKKNNYDIDYLLEPKGKDNFKRLLLWLIEQPFVKLVKLGIPFGIYWFHKKKYENIDTIVCINDAISFSILFWKFFGFIDSEVITLFQSLSERHNKYFKNNNFIIWIIRKLLGSSDKILVLSSSARHELTRVFKIPLEKIEVFYFGPDLSYWKYKDFNLKDRNYVLAIGNDMNRDYETLCKVVSGKYKTIIITRKKISCDGVEIKNGISNDEVMELYHGARIIITPSVKLLTESSGLSTTVQAMACGTPVLSSDSPAMRELFKEDEEIFYFEPENSENLEKKLNELWSNNLLLERASKNGRAIIENKFNSINMAKQLDEIIQ